MSAATTPIADHESVPRRQILQGDALTRLRDLPDGSIDCVVTSPPYFRLRDYGHGGQLGLERHVEDWVKEMRAIASEIARVLVPTGTLWLNVGDTYSTHVNQGAPRKSLLGAPERLMLGLIKDGWTLRNKIVWAKTNAIPSSVTDRLSTGHEFIYVLSRQPHYFFDLHAVREPLISRRSKPRDPTRPARRNPGRPWLGPNADGDAGLTKLHAQGIAGHPLGKNPGDVWRLSVSRYRGAHFATYPEQLVSRMVRAGCPEARCTVCRSPCERLVTRLGQVATRAALTPTCDCAAPWEPGLVLDPFLGAGTTAVAAEALGRDWLGIELNPEYIALAEQRIAAARTSAKPRKRKEVT